MDPSFDRVYQHFPKQDELIDWLIQNNPGFREICQDFQEIAVLRESLAVEIEEFFESTQMEPPAIEN